MLQGLQVIQRVRDRFERRVRHLALMLNEVMFDVALSRDMEELFPIDDAVP